MNKSLYEIGEQLQALKDLLEEVDGDVSDESVEEAINAWFEEVESNQNAKVNNYCKLIANLESYSKSREEEAARLSKAAKSFENKAKLLKERLLGYMRFHNIPKITTDLFTVSVANNGGKAPLTFPKEWAEEPASAPEQFHRRKLELDLTALRDALEAGDQIEGCEIGPRGNHLKIK